MGGLTLLGGGLASSIRLKIGDAVAFLSIPRASAVNRAAVRVDGGMVRHIV